MGDRGHNRHGPKRRGVLCLFRGALGTRLIQCGLRGGLYFRTKWRLHPSSRLATIVKDATGRVGISTKFYYFVVEMHTVINSTLR